MPVTAAATAVDHGAAIAEAAAAEAERLCAAPLHGVLLPPPERGPPSAHRAAKPPTELLRPPTGNHQEAPLAGPRSETASKQVSHKVCDDGRSHRCASVWAARSALCQQQCRVDLHVSDADMHASRAGVGKTYTLHCVQPDAGETRSMHRAGLRRLHGFLQVLCGRTATALRRRRAAWSSLAHTCLYSSSPSDLL